MKHTLESRLPGEISITSDAGASQQSRSGLENVYGAAEKEN